MSIHWPQGILLAVWALALMTAIRDSGKPMGNYDPVSKLVDIGVYGALLWWGGFWTAQ